MERLRSILARLLGSGVVERLRGVGERARAAVWEGTRREGLMGALAPPLPVLEADERRVRGGDLQSEGMIVRTMIFYNIYYYF